MIKPKIMGEQKQLNEREAASSTPLRNLHVGLFTAHNLFFLSSALMCCGCAWQVSSTRWPSVHPFLIISGVCAGFPLIIGGASYSKPDHAKLLQTFPFPPKALTSPSLRSSYAMAAGTRIFANLGGMNGTRIARRKSIIIPRLPGLSPSDIAPFSKMVRTVVFF